MRALTAVCVRLRLTAALTKLPVLTTSRNVRATLISIDQYLSGKAAIIFICLLTITGRSFLGKTASAQASMEHVPACARNAWWQAAVMPSALPQPPPAPGNGRRTQFSPPAMETVSAGLYGFL